jgi:hypothetical protein
MMQLLGIETLRPGANYFPEPGSPNNANYDESKANPYPDLPPLLRLQDGRAVTSSRLWSLRRAEIREAFDREVYGRVPTVTPNVRWQVVSTTNERIGGVAAVTRRLLGRVDNSAFTRVSVEIEMVLTLPGESKTAVPVMLRLGFIGPSPWPEGPLEPGPDWKAQLLATGWGFAILEANSIQPDDGAALTRGIIGLANRGQPRDADDWGALRAWAWGASRALDYLQDVRGVDAKRVGIEGLSRHGKAALVALAYDPRFAIGFIGSSGAGGAKLHRRDFGERVENLAAPSEYHWMAGNYIKYAGPLTAKDLPIDAHALIAYARRGPSSSAPGRRRSKTNGEMRAACSWRRSPPARPIGYWVNAISGRPSIHRSPRRWWMGRSHSGNTAVDTARRRIGRRSSSTRAAISTPRAHRTP